MKFISISDRMVSTAGRSTGFDYLRVLLALGVIVWHSFPLSYGPSYASTLAMNPIVGGLVGAILPMFFALSGFLVAGSLERNAAISTFVGLRVIRILPALFVEVFLSAIVLGPLLTTVPLGSYINDPKFFSYFLNVLGDIHYLLPGLFASNPLPDVVNGQLWTVPWELRCYVVLTVLALLGVTKRRYIFLILTFIVCAAVWVWGERNGGNQMVDTWRAGLGGTLLVGFLAAVALFKFRDVIPWNAWLCAVCAAAMFALMTQHGARNLAGYPAAYVTVYLGLANPRKIALLRGADYSYGLYLYGFVIQQAVVFIFPWSHTWYWNLSLVIPIAAMFAAFSWTVIEKPALKLKAYLPGIEKRLSKVSGYWRRSDAIAK